MLATDTICALATAQGFGAIGVIRVSGPDAITCTQKLFSKQLDSVDSHTLHFGTINDSKGGTLDEVLVSVFHESKSYTGEQSCEIAYHGSQYIAQQLLEALVHAGCRMANPGEYTQRAFLNGKLDLSQAEAVADLIASGNKNAHGVALKQMRGGFSSELKGLRDRLIEFASLVELELDFAEEDVEFADRSKLVSLIEEVLEYIARLIKSFEFGNAIKEGVPVAIVGAPNTGKSTLLNTLLNEDRAIVSNIAGTTRDVIEELLVIDGIQFRLIDTAGIREGVEEIESQGIERSKLKIEQAKIVLCLADATKEKSTAEVEAWTAELQDEFPDKTIILVVNKSDAKQLDNNHLQISAKSGEGVELLKKELSQKTQQGINLMEDTIVTNARHVEALSKAKTALDAALNGLKSGVSGDFVAMDIRQASFDLGSITGDISTDDLLGNIFANFCIGK